jgi:hypothetical protein
MKYALNVSDDSRILSVCTVLSNGNYEDMPIVSTFPEGDITDYLYIDDEYIHSPLPKIEVEEKPSQLDIIEAQVTYTAMMTDTLLEV